MTLARPQYPIRFASGLLAGLLLATLIAPAEAETTRLDAIIGASVLRVGLTEDYRPFSFAEASGKVEGIDVDMAMSLAQSLGVKLEIVKTSWSSLKSDLEGTASTSRWVGSPSPRPTENGVVLQPRLFKWQDADHALRRRTEIWHDRGDRSARRARDRQSGGNQRALRPGSS
jgi:Bacterial extracellular solute-binding proteins, family 3